MKYPYPHKHIPIEGGHITVEEGCSQETIEAVKKAVESLRNISPDQWKAIVEKHNEAKKW